ncbi:helix-hairpin-helix domain-containing protein [Ketobacter sp.]|uniref:helix-hairpin-helix domain-containing protein n=1 Tax=Ketobacter sp. TaxID=2083498 RepID=UPI000F13A7F8|nr:helix-hairpin-helix domain-containing protein [Ketobacter sp.]RLU01663.1 MAG: DNA ligase [Ketobacter sp.]
MDIKLTNSQMAAIKQAGIEIDRTKAQKLLSDDKGVWAFSPEDLTLILQIANATYRAGVPVMSDVKYDSIYVRELETQDPDSDFLESVEPEPVIESKTVALPVRMLSTEKAYSFKEIERWVSRLIKAANEIDLDLAELYIRVTPKLDGYAAFDDGEKLYTRGDGFRGQDISRAFKRGLKIAKGGKRGSGAGEIVIKKSYFEEKLSGYFENARNIQASIISEKKVDERIQEAIEDEACVFYPFELLENWVGHYEEFLEKFDEILKQIWNSVDYEVDGIIAEATNDSLKDYMGATRKNHRWQIAYKINAEIAEVTVKEVVPQTSRTGKLTPVALLEPTKLSGATISRATVHHYGMVKSKGVGKGAVVELVRSGLVIPKIESVLIKTEPDIPSNCPSCHSHVVWDGDNLFCPNTTDCPAQAENTMIHFFKTLRNVDGFGPKVVEKIYQSGVKSIHDIYGLDVSKFVEMGFGEKTSENLVEQLMASRNLEIDDWRFLAAFGVPRLGEGNCEKLLEHHNITEIFNLTVDDMVGIDGFAELSATTIFEGLKSIEKEFHSVYGLGFNLKATKSSDSKSSLPLDGELIVFTGSMEHGKRQDMEAEAKRLGAKIGKSVTSKTTLLVTGKSVGEKKISDATDKGVRVLSESEYLSMLKVSDTLS